MRPCAAIAAVLLLMSGHLQANTRGLDHFDFVAWAIEPSGLDSSQIRIDNDWLAQIKEQNIVTRLYESTTELGKHRIREQVTRVVAYVSEHGVRDSGNARTSVDAFSQRLVFTAAEVHLPDGEIIPVQPATVQVVTDTDDDVFTDDYDIIVPWPGLVAGAVTVLRYTVVTERDRLALPWSDLAFVQTLRPIQELQIGVTWDAGVVEPVMSTDAEFLSCDRAPRQVVCRATRVDSFPEDINVNYFDRLPTLAFTESETWQSLRQAVEAHVNAVLSQDDPRVEEFAKSLYRDDDSPKERVRKIHRFVARDVRYVGMEHGKNGIIPRSSAMTLENRYGDCKDKTVLFVDLARRAGIEVFPVLTSTDRTALDNVLLPGSRYFDHMVACGVLYDEQFCVDLTDPFSAADFIPASLQGALALRLDNRANEPELLPRDDYRWRMRVHSVNHLQPDGTLTERVVREYQSVYGAQMRSYYAAMSADDRIDEMRGDFGDFFRTADTAQFALNGVDDLGGTVEIVVDNEYDDYYTGGDLEVRESASWLKRFIDYFEAENKLYPYELTGYRFESIVEFNLKDQFSSVQPGAILDLVSEFGSLKRDYDYDKGSDRMRVTTTLEVPAQDIVPDDIDAYNDFLSALKRHSATRFSAYE